MKSIAIGLLSFLLCCGLFLLTSPAIFKATFTLQEELPVSSRIQQPPFVERSVHVSFTDLCVTTGGTRAATVTLLNHQLKVETVDVRNIDDLNRAITVCLPYTRYYRDVQLRGVAGVDRALILSGYGMYAASLVLTTVSAATGLAHVFAVKPASRKLRTWAIASFVLSSFTFVAGAALTFATYSALKFLAPPYYPPLDRDGAVIGTREEQLEAMAVRRLGEGSWVILPPVIVIILMLLAHVALIGWMFAWACRGAYPVRV